MILSPAFGLTSVVVGILFSLLLDVAPGATIVLTGLGILSIVLVVKKVASLLGGA
jgi:ABC-type Mn2+/Zn2+ transport system permease subunit